MRYTFFELINIAYNNTINERFTYLKNRVWALQKIEIR